MNFSAPVVITFPSFKWLYGWMALVCLGMAAYCMFYLAHDHSYLTRWFLGLNPCIYRRDNWEGHLFTPATKWAGNRYAAAGLITALTLGYLLVKKLLQGKIPPAIRLQVSGRDGLALLCLLATGTAAWGWAYSRLLPYNDEVFSVVHCAGAHPFQTFSYYMLPNNHILFNGVNNLLFRHVADLLVTGRILSGVAYLLWLFLIYFWFRQQTGNRFLALLLSAAAGLQFNVWGFSAMARGYEWHLLCEYASFIFLIRYLTTGERQWLPLMALVVIAGTALVPTFLYFYIPLLATAFICQCAKRQADFPFWKYQLVTFTGIFLFYLPAIGFSGAGSFAENNPVMAAGVSREAFMSSFGYRMNMIFQYGFSGWNTSDYDIAAFLTILPVLLILWFRRQERLLLALFYSLLWLTLSFVSLWLMKYPPLRSLIGQHSLAYTLLLLLFCWTFQEAGRRSRVQWVPVLLTTLLAVGGAAFFIGMARERLPNTLFHFDINYQGYLQVKVLEGVSAGAELGCSDESFYQQYTGGNWGIRTTLCPTGKEAYFMKSNEEAFPFTDSAQYRQLWDRAGFTMYQRR